MLFLFEKKHHPLHALPPSDSAEICVKDVAHPLKYHFPYLRPPIGTFTFGARSSSSQVAA